MDSGTKDSPKSIAGKEAFGATAWDVVVRARQGDPGALETLADRYWYPLYAYLRREGNTADDAADLVQGFLADLLRRPEIGEPDAGRGKFRTFLLVRLRSHARDRWRRERNSEKRGKGYEFVPLDFDVAETCYGRETSEHASPQVLFDHAWARAVLAAARERVRSDMIDRGKGQWFARLEWILDDAGGGARGYSDIARHLQTSESNVKVVALRMRKRFTEAVLAILRAEQGMGVLGEIPDYLIAEDDVKDSAALVRLIATSEDSLSVRIRSRLVADACPRSKASEIGRTVPRALLMGVLDGINFVIQDRPLVDPPAGSEECRVSSSRSSGIDAGRGWEHGNRREVTQAYSDVLYATRQEAILAGLYAALYGRSTKNSDMEP